MGLVDPYEGGGLPCRPLPRWAVLSFPCDVAGTGLTGPRGQCGVSAACRPVSGVAGLVGLGPFLPPPRGRGGGGRGLSPR